jgi:hypothetical protein
MGMKSKQRSIPTHYYLKVNPSEPFCIQEQQQQQNSLNLKSSTNSYCLYSGSNSWKLNIFLNSNFISIIYFILILFLMV